MQAEINLLPQKKPSTSAGRKLVFILLSLFILGIAGITTAKILAVIEVSELKAQVKSLQDHRSQLENKQSESTQGNTEMLNEINLLVSTRVATTEVMNEMIVPLQNKTVMNITYEESGTATIVTKMTKLEHVASYQQELIKAEGIEEVTIVKVAKNQQELEQLAQMVEGDTEAPPTEAEKASKEYFAELQISFKPEIFMINGGDE